MFDIVGKNLFVLTKPWIGIPAGFITDFASVPRIFWPVISPIDNHAFAALSHDYGYFAGMHTRRLTDRVFYIDCIRCGTPVWKAKAMYIAVRLFGWHRWNQCRKLDKR